MRSTFTPRLSLVVLALGVAGCSELPAYIIGAGDSSIAPSGPTVASLVANLKCELWDAANDDSAAAELRYFRDDQALTLHPPSARGSRFTLHELFKEIEFIGEAEYTLDVTQTTSANPSAQFITPYIPSTYNFTLAVGGQLSDSANRFVNLYSSVEFERLVQSPLNKWYAELKNKTNIHLVDEPPLARDPRSTEPNVDDFHGVAWSVSDGENPCDRGSELGGNLGLKESLGVAAEVARMNDVAVFEGDRDFSPVVSAASLNQYSFGQLTADVDFTITAGVNGGPTWNLTHFKGPSGGGGGGSGSGNGSGGTGGGNQGLLNYNRVAKDTLLITFLPVCIRQAYFPTQWLRTGKDGRQELNLVASKSSNGRSIVALPPLKYPIYSYDPELSFGTPGWANYLPPCNSAAGQAAKLLAPARARQLNQASQGALLIQQQQ